MIFALLKNWHLVAIGALIVALSVMYASRAATVTQLESTRSDLRRTQEQLDSAELQIELSRAALEAAQRRREAAEAAAAEANERRAVIATSRNACLDEPLPPELLERIDE